MPEHNWKDVNFDGSYIGWRCSVCGEEKLHSNYPAGYQPNDRSPGCSSPNLEHEHEHEHITTTSIAIGNITIKILLDPEVNPGDVRIVYSTPYGSVE